MNNMGEGSMTKKWILSLICAITCLVAIGVCWSGTETPTKVRKGSLKHDGFTRNYLYYIPSSLKPNHAPAPLLIAMHGGGGDAKGMVRLTNGRFNELAERDGWVVVYPAGMQKQWNDGRYEMVQHPGAEREMDDIGFLSKLIDKFVKEYGVDPRRVYVTGISNGGLMSNRLACELSDKVAAAAPVAASLSVLLSKNCNPSNSTPMLWINGDVDPLVPYQGGEIKVLWTKRGKVLPVPEAVKFWAGRNGCDVGKPLVENLPDRDPDDKTTVERTTYGKMGSGHEVILYTIHGGGHTWPQGWPYLGERMVGRVSQEFNACDVIWEFLSRQKR
jgi:polyhydroxybutyrate depolymerase